ncbi:N-acyl-D-amino-acid deacylase [Sediminihabitans luteus]|uniref:N-acyl-D-amino-acid deacylase n=1 Tax=Sediminihabitans luteus TaxID=1138585 RepID=A0A2M9CDK5_9CELL|nr:amidohydrolase family protein [Sediminihabitans luteus]PJJ69942.1 N-acyl-D-amino-acid deacylase [Sediminihabitans luteus]GII99262.1 N-acyl-D-aspartate/D-glutamate deacylase [Sediminihabitans luteus]
MTGRTRADGTAGGPAGSTASTTAGDVLVRGARLPDATAPDGIGSPVDLLVRDGRVADVVPAGSRTPYDAPTVLDAEGRLAMPGFVDAHVHGEAAVLDPDVQLALLRQGVTSIVVGQDGVSFAPSPAPATSTDTPDVHDGLHDSYTWSSGYFAAINGAHPTFRGGGVGDLLATYDGTTPVNVAALLPHGTLRYAVLGGADRPATAAETDRLVALARRAFDEGACGLSTGLEYVPAAYADEAELVALARVAAERGLPHVSHMRGYEDKAGPAFAELVRIARASGVATHVSHYHGPHAELLGYVDDALDAGLDVTFDSYPYLRGCSILSMVSLPTWLPIAEPERAVAMLRDPAVVARLHAEHFPGLADLWPRVTMANVPGEHAWTEGLTLPDVAARLGLAPADAALTLLVSTGLRAGCVFAQPPTNSPDSVRALLRHRAHMGGSDAIYGGGMPHPRGWGAFARFLAEHVRTLGDWTWADAAHHLAAAPAARFGFAGRGTLVPGSVADLSLVDPAAVQDVASYDAPRRPASGIADVLVAGVPVLRDGAPTGATPGRALRPGA